MIITGLKNKQSNKQYGPSTNSKLTNSIFYI